MEASKWKKAAFAGVSGSRRLFRSLKLLSEYGYVPHLSDQLDAALDEAAQRLAFQHTVAQEGEVYELADHLVRRGVVGPHLVALGAELVQLVVGVGHVLLLLGGDFLFLLLALRLAQVRLTSLPALDVAQDGFQLLAARLLLVGQDLLDERVVGVQHEVVAIRHLAIERHARLHGRHLAHPTHILALREHNGVRLLAQGLEGHVEFRLLHLRHLALEDLAEGVLLVLVQRHLAGVLLADEVVDGIAIHPGEAALLELLLQLPDDVHVQLPVHLQHAVAFVLGGLYVAVLLVLIVRVEVNQVALLVGLRILDEVLIFLESEVLALHVFQQGELGGAVVKLLVRQHSELDEEFQAVPFLLELRTVVLENLLQPVGHLLGDVAGYLLHVLVALQVRAGDVQRDVRRVEHAVQQRQELRHDALHRVGHEHLVAIQLYLVTLQVDVALDAREIQDTGQIERVIHVQVYPEERFLRHGIQVAVEFLVILVGQLRGLAHPRRLGVVDDVVLVGVDILAVFPLLLLAESDLYRKKAAILLQQSANLILVQEVLVLVVDIQDDIGTPVVLGRLLQRVLRRSVAAPFHRHGAFLVRASHDLHLLGDHERRVEAQPEMTDDSGRVVLVLLHELLRSGEGDLVDVFIDFLGGHTDTAVGDGDGLIVELDPHGQVAQLSLELADRRERLQLLRRVDRVRNQLTQKNLVVAI